MRLSKLRRPGVTPHSFPRSLRRFVRSHGMTVLQLREMATNVSLRTKLRELAGITEAELARVLAALEKLIPLSDPSLAAAPVAIPPLGGMLAPDHRALAFDDPPIANFWANHSHVLPHQFDHLDLFRYKPVIAQRGPNCVGHACRNATEVQLNICDRHLSGLFAWEYAMQKRDYPIPPTGTWPAVVLQGACERGICTEQLYPETNFCDSRYVKPDNAAIADAKKRRIETFVSLRPLIGEPDTIDLMCLLLYGSEALKLKGRVLILGVGLPEEWLLPESLFTGVRPLPLSDDYKGGHSFILVGYFHHQGRRWFIGLENWGERIGSQNPFGYPRTMGLVFIPADFFRNTKLFWDLAITATHEEAKLFHSETKSGALMAASPRLTLGLSRFQAGLASTAAALGVLRYLFPGNWW